MVLHCCMFRNDVVMFFFNLLRIPRLFVNRVGCVPIVLDILFYTRRERRTEIQLLRKRNAHMNVCDHVVDQIQVENRTALRTLRKQKLTKL